jgi:hypothetical protein
MSRGSYGLYLVTGRRRYRGHAPGTRFEARLDPGAEQRAISLGAIRLLKRITPALDPGSYRLPDDWPPAAADAPATTEAPKGASLIGKE